MEVQALPPGSMDKGQGSTLTGSTKKTSMSAVGTGGRMIRYLTLALALLAAAQRLCEQCGSPRQWEFAVA
jgi:hypothetical protein